MPIKPSIRAAAIGAAVAGGVISGALLAAPVVSGAQQPSSNASSASASFKRANVRTQTNPTTTDPQQDNQSGQPDQSNHPGHHPKGAASKGGHVGQNGQKEELLTGDNAEKVKAAAQAAVPGATIDRVETDAEGAAFEAHITKSDGSDATVKLDANFTVTSVEDGHR